MYEELVNLLEDNNKDKHFNFMKVTPEELSEIGEREGVSNKSNLYFLMQEALMDYEKNKELDKAAYIAHLISYYLYIVFTPINNYELSLKYARKSIEYNSTQIDYKEWILIFSESLNEDEIFEYLQEVSTKKPESSIAKYMIM